MGDWLREGGDVGIHDATNSTRARREFLFNKARSSDLPARIIFFESLCTDREVVMRNVGMKAHSPDYKDRDAAEAKADFLKRLAAYEEQYEPLDETELGGRTQFLKLINVGRSIEAHQINGFLCSQLMFYLTNIHIEDRKIYLTTHGESEDTACGRIGGDAPLTAAGEQYAVQLAKWVKANL